MSHHEQKSTGAPPTALYSQGGGAPVEFCGGERTFRKRNIRVAWIPFMAYLVRLDKAIP